MNWHRNTQRQSAQPRPRQFDRALIDQLKETVTIFTVWEILYPDTFCPTRDGAYDAPWATNHGSLSIFNEGRAWKDHASDSDKGDVINFTRRATGFKYAPSVEFLLQVQATLLRPDGDGLPNWPEGLTQGAQSLKATPPPLARPFPTPLRAPTRDELAFICHHRGLGTCTIGLQLMVGRGLLFSSTWSEHDACATFVVTDQERTVALRRRQDGMCWDHWDKPNSRWLPGKGPKSKTWTAYGGAKRPIGLPLLRTLDHGIEVVFIVEGPPDAWALFQLLWNVIGSEEAMKAIGVIIMPDSGTNFTEGQAALLKGLHVRLVPQDDCNAKPDAEKNSGEEAAQRWATQVHAAGAIVSIFRLHPHLPVGGKDLCDAAKHAFTTTFPNSAVTLARHLISNLPTH